MFVSVEHLGFFFIDFEILKNGFSRVCCGERDWEGKQREGEYY